MTLAESPLGSPLFTDSFYLDPMCVGDDVRATAPVHCAMLPDGIPVWVISRYADALAALKDERLSHVAGDTVRRLLVKAGKADEVSHMHDKTTMLNSDPPEHERLRRLVANKFTRRRVADLQRPIEVLATDLLDRMPVDRPVDLVRHFAYPLPLIVICELIGVPERDRGQFRTWTEDLVADQQARSVPASKAMATHFRYLIDEKRAAPGDDLLSALLHVPDGEDRLTLDELMGTLFLLLVAGHEASTNLIGNSVRWLLDQPERWLLLHREPDLTTNAVEELMRFDSPVRMAPLRRTIEPVEYAGVTIPADQLVYVALGAANRDPDRFDRASELDLRRGDARRHVGFGHGIHHCLGAYLGRLEAEIAIRALTNRYPNARLYQPDKLRHKRAAIMNGYGEVSVVLGG